ncbi:hypothetical protein Y032_0015g2628 [Ancylostoma ceylanicum]|uniref:Uncharacterized protein n=1 Tax=Ancylostoma ceylanicum TaxID=53326 RepID=A0A016V8Q1_9BILA|nr:hypothetical protein Y032_0015g2628 [Ancylostoma ceylanicum]
MPTSSDSVARDRVAVMKKLSEVVIGVSACCVFGLILCPLRAAVERSSTKWSRVEKGIIKGPARRHREDCNKECYRLGLGQAELQMATEELEDKPRSEPVFSEARRELGGAKNNSELAKKHLEIISGCQIVLSWSIERWKL